ncbi:conserved hypothetical protein [Sporisorium reilianum SRZ2]|uniref:Uncharacterized protein n=1 Tax=Sporisorium reilianum (strain SRZ2) TaxID=999809 RepID=E6ZSE5_SPORE|nr:conserved hypothetical protein [Sporisorium reilianum SRZ2]
MQASDPSSSVVQDLSLEHFGSQQDGFEIVSQRRVEPLSERIEPFEAWQAQFKQEEQDHDFPVPPLISTADAYNGSQRPISFRPHDVPTSSKGHPPHQATNGASDQHSSLYSSNVDLAVDWNALQSLPDAQIPPRRGSQNGRLLQHPPYNFQASSSVRTAQHSDLAPPSSSLADLDATLSSTRSAISMRAPAPEPRDSEPNRLKEIEESIHCFWLVSENRMSQVQDELRDISANTRGTLLEQEQMSLQMAQILPLQVEIAQKVVRAADDRRVIYSRIRSLEESSAAWQKELKTMLEAMQAEFRAGMEIVHELAAKGRKPPPAPKVKSEAAAAAATATAAATTSAPAATATTPATTTAPKNNKRPSPTRKKTSPSNGKKAKVPPADDEESVAPPPSSAAVSSIVATKQGVPDSSQDNDQQQQPQQQQQQQHHHYQHQRQLRPQPPATAWTRENRSQSHSQPMLPSHHDLSFDQVQLVPRPHTAAPYLHDIQPNIGSMEMAMRH